MMDKPPLIVPFLLFVFLVLSSLASVFAEQAARMAARYFEWSVKRYGFDAKVEATPRAVQICRIWNTVMAFLFTACLMFVLWQ